MSRLLRHLPELHGERRCRLEVLGEMLGGFDEGSLASLVDRLVVILSCTILAHLHLFCPATEGAAGNVIVLFVDFDETVLYPRLVVSDHLL